MQIIEIKNTKGESLGWTVVKCAPFGNDLHVKLRMRSFLTEDWWSYVAAKDCSTKEKAEEFIKSQEKWKDHY